MSCRECGAENRDGAKFCVECGARMQQACPSCGAATSGGRFCPECGAALVPPVSTQQGQPAPPSAHPEPVAERRTTSVLFADLVGFTSMSETRDPEETREFLTRYFTTCRTVLARYGGTVEKFIGDAVMAVWGVPVSREDDAERAVRAGIDLVGAVAALGGDGQGDVAVRVGVVTGEVAVTLGAQGEGMVAGDAVNTAARVQSAAGRGEVWVDEPTRALTAAAITFADAGTHELKGKAEPVQLYRADQVVAAVGGAQRVDGLTAPFTGRDRELLLVKELYHATLEDDRARLVSVVGEAGVGKSRLSWEFEKYADGITQLTRWHRGRCLSYGEGVAFWAFAEMVRGRIGAVEGDSPSVLAERLRTALDGLVGDPDERDYLRPRLATLIGATDAAVPEGGFARPDLFAAWRTFLERLADGGSIVALVVEDLQWADDGLLDFFEHLVETSRAPVFILTMSRPDLLQRRPHWGSGRRVTSIYLEPLNDTAMSAVVDGLVGGLPDEVRSALVGRAEGVPLYAVETIRALIDRDAVVPREGRYVVAEDVASRVDLSALAAPASLTALIAARLDSLPPAERRAVQDASVLGTSFGLEGLTAVAGGGDHAAVLDSLVRKEVLAIEADPRSPERGQYRFVQGLVRTVAYDTLGRRDRKLRHLAAAEFYASSSDADDLAGVVASHYLSAHDAAPGDPDADDLTSRAATLLERAGARAAELGSNVEGLRYLQRALELSIDPDCSARISSAAAKVAFAAGELVAAAELGRRSQALWTELGRVDLAATAAATAADAMQMRGDVVEAQLLAQEALDTVDGVAGAERPTLSLLLVLAGCKNALGQIDQGVPYLERALSLAEALSDWALLVRALNHYGATHVIRGRPTVGVAVIDAALQLARREKLVAADIMPLNNLIALQLYRDLPAARAAGEEGLASARQHGERTLGGWLACNLSFARWLDGSWDEIDRLVEDCAAGTPGATFQEEITLLTQALARTARGDVVDRPALADYLTSEDVSIRAMALLEGAVVSLSQGSLAEAADLAIQGADTFFGVAGIEDDYPLFWVPGVELALETGRLDEARRLLATVADAPQALVPPYLRAQLQRLRALVAVAEQDDAAAEPELVQAVEGLRAYGAPFYTARAQLELAELLSRAGRSAEAREQAEAARELFSRLGATPWVERAAVIASLAAV